MRRNYFIIFYFVALFLVLPLPIQAKTLNISSYPMGSDVFVKPLKGGDFIKIGETPFSLSFKEIVQMHAKENVFLIEIRKKDHTPYRVLMADFQDADVNLEVKLEMIDEHGRLIVVDEIVQILFDAQRLIRAKSYNDAINLLNDGIKKFPKVSSLYEMKASGYYVQKDYPNALEFYKEAFKFNPNNYDAYKMKMYLEKTLANPDGENK